MTELLPPIDVFVPDAHSSSDFKPRSVKRDAFRRRVFDLGKTEKTNLLFDPYHHENRTESIYEKIYHPQSSEEDSDAPVEAKLGKKQMFDKGHDFDTSVDPRSATSGLPLHRVGYSTISRLSPYSDAFQRVVDGIRSSAKPETDPQVPTSDPEPQKEPDKPVGTEA